MIARAAALSVSMLVGAVQCQAPAPVDVQPPAETLPEVTGVAAIIPGEAGTSVAGRCTQWEDLLAQHPPSAGWDVHRMSTLMWRESRCRPDVRSRTSDTGLLQINDVNLAYLRDVLQEDVTRWTLADPVQNVRAAAALCEYWAARGSCYQPWSSN